MGTTSDLWELLLAVTSKNTTNTNHDVNTLVCPICGATKSSLITLGAKSLGPKWNPHFNLSWVRCSKCTHTFVWPFLSAENLTRIYSTSYSNQAAFSSAVRRGQSQFELLEHLQIITPKSKDLRVLEQGCARGALLNLFANISSRMFCLEPDNDVKAEAIKGKDREKLTLIRSVDVSGDEVADNSIDLWLGSHVIEHFADPNHFLSSAYRKLRPEGILFQEFPLQSNLPKADIASDYHLNYYSGKSIHVALTKHGFCQVAMYKITDRSNIFKGYEYWPEVSMCEIHNTVQQLSYGVFRVVYRKCRPN